MAVTDYSTTPSANTAINTIDISEGCSPKGLNDAIRQMMADIRSVYDARMLLCNQRLVIKSSALFDGTLDTSSGLSSADAATAGKGTVKARVSGGKFVPAVTGWHKVTLIGGGGGGGGGSALESPYYSSGGGGASGSKRSWYMFLTAGVSYAFTIGAGGGAGAIDVNGEAGGYTHFYVASGVDTAVIGGLGGGRGRDGAYGGHGGAFGYSGTAGNWSTGPVSGGKGGGQGAGNVGFINNHDSAYYGAGGPGGPFTAAGGAQPGKPGSSGCIILEYFDPTVTV